jgi:hypothetical protein
MEDKERAKIITDQTNDIAESLGITDQRAKELGDACVIIFKDCIVDNPKDDTRGPECIERMLQLAKHPNEATHMMIMFGYNLKAYHDLNFVKNMMSRVFGI